MLSSDLSPAKKAVFSLAVILLIIILAEILSFLALKLFFSEKSDGGPSINHYNLDPYLVFRPDKNYFYKDDKPAKMNRGKPGRQLRMNSLGFRGDDFKPQKPEGQFRIFLLGGSVAFNGSTDDRTIAGFLQKKLRSEFPKHVVKVINGGRSSYVSGQTLAHLIFEVLNYAPDLLIVFQGNNDVYGSIHGDRRPGYPHAFGKIEERVNTGPLILAASYILSKSYTKKLVRRIALDIYLKLGSKLQEKLNKKEPNFPYMDKYVQHTETFAGIAAGMKIPAIISIQPSIYTKKNKSAEEEEIITGAAVEAMRENYQYSLKKFKKFAWPEGVVFSDLSNVFDEIDYTMYWDNVHFFDDGNEIVADKFFNIIKKEKLLSARGKNN
ncbi:MAG: SGNH/GDSL hydrolase family protein [bacterium]